MSRPAIGDYKTEATVLVCPRCRIHMQEVREREAFIDRCARCQGTFFDLGEMFSALDRTADPAYWDRPETAGAVKPGDIACPRCEASMLLQDISDDAHQVEIDRCTHCGGIWLDGGEAEKIIAIGAGMAGTVEAEQRAAQAELADLDDVDFRPKSLFARFLSIFKK